MACLLTVCENAQLNKSCYGGKLALWFGALLLILVSSNFNDLRF